MNSKTYTVNNMDKFVTCVMKKTDLDALCTSENRERVCCLHSKNKECRRYTRLGNIMTGISGHNSDCKATLGQGHLGVMMNFVMDHAPGTGSITTY